jgi:tripartite-type tricarboxylate transporter receptor subunit TctC
MEQGKRKTLSWLAAAGVVACFGATSLHAQAQAKNIQIVVPYAPGGTTDILGRILAEKLADPMATSVIVENKPGAGTVIGASYVARSPADGKTLLVATSTTLAVNPWLYKKLSYNPVKDFAPVALIAAVPLALVVHPSVEAKTLAELVALAKSGKAGTLNYASAGNGSPHHLVAEMFKSAVGIKLLHIPYKGSSPALTDVVAGHIPMMFTDIAPALPFILSGRLKVLAVTSQKRVSALPNVATIAESQLPGTKDFEGVAWQGVVAPAGTPQPVIDKLSAEIVKIMLLPEVRAKLEKDGVEIRTRTSAAFADYIASELSRWEEVVKSSGATID